MEKEQEIDKVLARLSRELSVFEKAKVREQLILYVNNLLLNDFNRLVQLLYAVDISESLLKSRIAENPQYDTAILIADMMIERLEQKRISRQHSTPPGEISEDEKW